MNVLYVSKASRVAAHREKLRLLAGRVEPTLVTPDLWGGEPWEPAPFDEHLDVRRLPTVLHGHNHLHVYRRLAGVLDSGDFDVVHIDEEPYSLVTVQAARLARRRRLPAVFFAWQNLDKRLPPPFGSLRRHVFRIVAGGIAGTEEAARVLRSAGFGGPLLVSPQMGVSMERFQPDDGLRRARRRALGLEEGDRLAGFVGRLVPEKGVDLLVRALPALPRCHLAVVGEGEGAGALLRLAAALGVVDRVHAPGHVPSLEVPGWMAALDVLALPSRSTPAWKEQFGRVVVEAMACEVPVVVSDSGALPTVVGDAGRVVPEGSLPALRDALGALLRAPEERARMGRLGRARVLGRYTDRMVVDEQVGFYEKVVGHGTGPGRTGSGAGGEDPRRARGRAP